VEPKARYAGFDPTGTRCVEPDPLAKDTLQTRRLVELERENERLRGVLRNQEAALRTAGRLLQPYISKAR
jgi:hypothetical protein